MKNPFLINLKSCLLTYRLNFYKIRKNKFNLDLELSEILKKFNSLNLQYDYFHHYFWNLSPVWLQEHRNYFSLQSRSFGEDAFHAMWFKIFQTFKPINILEIGIYRGSTITLFSLLSEKLGIKSEIHGISPFSSAGDSVSIYLKNLDYYNDVISNFKHFRLKEPILHKGYSNTDSMSEVIRSKKWDLIFIDGNHDYEIVKSDFLICSENLSKGGLIVLDDSSLYTSYKPNFFATAGHPGPSLLADEINRNLFIEILAVGHNRIFKKL